MKALTTSEHRTLIDAQRALVRVGWHPAVAGSLVRAAAGRVLGARDVGLGKVQQTRSLRRDLDPGIAPRLQVSGERCVRIQETPGDETGLYTRLDGYRSKGWYVFETRKSGGFPSVRVFWACPPGAMPQEAQSEALESQPWGAPLYVKERS